MIGEIHKNDIGTAFRLEIRDEDDQIIDISAATIKQVIFRKPDGTILSKDGSFTTNGTNGLLEYVSVSGDLDQIGMWSVQAKIKVGSGEWSSDVSRFKTFANLE